MASNDPDEGVTQQRIQFLDSTIVSPARSKEMGLADPNVKGPMVAERISADIDDEEKARRIADEDLNKKRKQVS